MKIHAFIPYSNVKETYGVKFIKDVENILDGEIHDKLAEFVDECSGMTIWDDSGSRCKKVGRVYTLTVNSGNAIELVTNAIGHIAEGIEELYSWLNGMRQKSLR